MKSFGRELLGRHPGGTMWGLVVLRTKGMASWARSWQEHTEGAVPHRPSKGSAPSASPLSSTGDEVVRVLAGMVWAFQKEGGMMGDPKEKIKSQHLRRNAYLYVRQSTLRQVMENTESTERQYGLRQRAIQLGWAQEQIVVIDSDLGQSGASAADREGFQYLVAEVGLGRAGIVMGLEVSRLARNSADWHRLLEMCALHRDTDP